MLKAFRSQSNLVIFTSFESSKDLTFLASKSLDCDWTVAVLLVSSSESDMSEREEEEALDMALEAPIVMSMLDTIFPPPSEKKLNDFQSSTVFLQSFDLTLKPSLQRM